MLFLKHSASIIVHNEEKSFLSWMRTNNQYYTGDEYSFRIGIFLSNLRKVNEHNKQQHLYTLTANKFACLTRSEYQSMLGVKISTKRPRLYDHPEVNFAIPESIDWRSKGIVTDVKDQGGCGSCWAFSICAAHESCWAKKHSDLYELSPSELVDCNQGGSGCGGAWPFDAIDWIIQNHGGKFMLLSDYPYVAKQLNCRWDEARAVAPAKSYILIDIAHESEMENHCANDGPLSVCIDACLTEFQLYHGGIFSNPACSYWGVDHAVSAVGYGSEEGEKYWILKNSWGSDWGEAGYIRMLRGENMCGVASCTIVISN